MDWAEYLPKVFSSVFQQGQSSFDRSAVVDYFTKCGLNFPAFLSHFFYRIELEHRFSVARAVHSFPCLDKRINGKNAYSQAATYVPDFTERSDILIRTESLNIAETIYLADVRVEIKVLKSGATFSRQLQFQPLRRHPVDGVQVFQRFLKRQQICSRNITANIDVLCYISATVDDSCEAADEDEFDAAFSQPFNEFEKAAFHTCFALRSVLNVSRAI